MERRTWTIWLAAAALGLTLAGTALARTTQTVPDPRGDSRGPVDLKSVTVTQNGLDLDFAVYAYRAFTTAQAPCVFVYAGRHNRVGRDGWAIGCFGRYVTTSDGRRTPIRVTRLGPTGIRFRLDPAAIGSPGRFRWQAIAAAERTTFDRLPFVPRTFDGRAESGARTVSP